MAVVTQIPGFVVVLSVDAREGRAARLGVDAFEAAVAAAANVMPRLFEERREGPAVARFAGVVSMAGACECGL
jgi:hypothetical protein